MRIRHQRQYSFKSGELSPSYMGRVDSPIYFQGAETYENFVTRLSGGAVFRPGTVHVSSSQTDSYATRLVSVVVTDTDKNILELGSATSRVFRNHAYRTSFATTWAVADVFTVRLQQVANNMYCAHGDYPPQKLNVTAWSIAECAITGTTFNTANNCPIAVGYHNDRLFFAGTNSKPQDIWGSVAGDVSDFTIGSSDDAAFSFTVASKDNRKMRWLESVPSGLLVGTMLGEGLLMDNNDNYIAPSVPMKFRWVTNYGSAAIQGVPFEGRVLFVQNSKRILREFFPTQAAYESPTMIYMAEHILKDVVDMAVSREPWPMIWCVKDNGEIAVLSKAKETGVMAWSRIVTDGDFESVAIIPGDEEDEVWVTVKRTIGGATKRFVEYFKPFLYDYQEDGYHVDCGVSVDHGSDVIASMAIQTPKTITAITRADPAVVTCSGHGFSNGDEVYIDDVGGMVALNEREFTVTDVTTDTFALSSEDSSLYTTYTSGGEVVKSPNLYVEATTALASLGWTDGDHVLFANMVGTTELEAFHYPITNVGTTSFEVRTKTVTHYTTWTSGEMRKVVSSVSGLLHLASEVVTVIGDGAYHGEETVNVSSVALGEYYNKIHAGLPYDGEIKTMNLNPLLYHSRANTVHVRFLNTLGGQIGTDDDNVEDIIIEAGSDIASTAEWYTGDYVVDVLPGTIETETHLVIKQDKSLPMTVLAYAAREGVYGG